MRYIETTTRISTKLIFVFYLIYKLTSVQEKRRYGNRYRRMEVVADSTSKIQYKREIFSFVSLQYLHANNCKINLFPFLQNGESPT
jgi:hypothetical protein